VEGAQGDETEYPSIVVVTNNNTRDNHRMIKMYGAMGSEHRRDRPVNVPGEQFPLVELVYDV
jgi:hypothetical protein